MMMMMPGRSKIEAQRLFPPPFRVRDQSIEQAYCNDESFGA
jgi:hypothetical protein